MARPTPKSSDSRLVNIESHMADIDIAMVTTIGDASRLVSRPLSTQYVHLEAGLIRFFTNRSSPKMAELARDSRINLAYASKDRNVYVSVAGHGHVNDDPGVKDALWNDALKAFFPGGKDDPDLTVLDVRIESVELWEGPSSWIGKAVGFLIARVTGREDAMGEQVHIEFQQPGPATDASTVGR